MVAEWVTSQHPQLHCYGAMLVKACGRKPRVKCMGSGFRPPSPRGNPVRCEWSFQGNDIEGIDHLDVYG